MPTKQEVIAAIHSGELFTPEYQALEKQRKEAAMRERIERQKQNAVLYAKMKPVATSVADTNPYEGKGSGDYTGD